MKRNFNLSGGFSLAEVAIAMGVSTIVIAGVIATFNIVNTGSAQYNLIQARNEIINKIRTQSLNPANLIASAKITETLGQAGLPSDHGPSSTLQFPDLLRKCLPDLSGSDTYGCNKTTIEEPGHGFLFYLAENGNLDPERSTAGEDVYYRNTGMKCTSSESANSGACPLMARVWFEPYCLNFATSCTKAMSVAIRYAVGLREDFKTDIAVPTVEGEFYVPLQRGIQIKNVFNQLDSIISPNSKGLFVVPKYYGSVGQMISGLRFEATISNPYGLVSMKIQGRSLTGTEAKAYGDDVVPSPLLNKTWVDVETPGNPGAGAWSINLAGAIPNQSFNFGTQLNIAANSRIPTTTFEVGKSTTPTTDPKYHWTLNSTNTEFIAPVFKSGFYQFRVIATDVMGETVESTNYVTVRIISTPEYKFVSPNFSPNRDCINSDVNYTVFIGDDEEITYNQIKINSTIYSTPTLVGTDEKLDFTFAANQPAGSYPITLTLKNRFSDVQLETLLVPKVQDILNITLNEITPSLIPGITNNPSKFRLNTTGQVSVNYTTGNCCNASPKVNWAFLNSSYFTGVLLDIVSPSINPSTMNCVITGNSRTCLSTIDVKGIAESPSMSLPPPNISATVNLGSSASNNACLLTSNVLTKHIPVVKIPNISFYMSESLWLNIPGSGTTIRSFNSSSNSARVVVRSDFAPSSDVTVEVVNALNPAQVFCSLTFNSGLPGAAIDQFCNIPSSFTGDLVLQRAAASVALIRIEGETPNNNHVAKIGGNVVHRLCQGNITSVANAAATYTVPNDKPMTDSPYGTVTLTNGTVTQNSKNDTGYWTAGRVKPLRCYDHWGLGSSNFNYNDPYNYQDYYANYKYNTETIVGTSTPARHRFISGSSSTSGPVSFPTFTVPNNPPILVDNSAENIPYFYMVLQDGVYGNVAWGINEAASGIVAYSNNKDWDDVTSQVCSGSNSLSKIKLLRTKINVETTSSSVIMRATNRLDSRNMNGAYSYLFMCTYGRYNPNGASSTGWVD